MIITLNYDETLALFNELGKEGFIKHFKELYPDFILFGYGLDWINDKRYILKFKGAQGDLIVKWEE